MAEHGYQEAKAEKTHGRQRPAEHGRQQTTNLPEAKNDTDHSMHRGQLGDCLGNKFEVCTSHLYMYEFPPL